MQWELAELPLADVSLLRDPMMPEVKLGSHLLPDHLAFMKEVNDMLTQRDLGGCWQLAASRYMWAVEITSQRYSCYPWKALVLQQGQQSWT